MSRAAPSTERSVPRSARPVGRLAGNASVALRPLVTGPPRPLSVAAVYPAAIHLADPVSGRVLLALVARDAVAHPHAVVLPDPVADRPFAGMYCGQELLVGQRRVVTPAGDVEVVRWWSPRPSLGVIDPGRLADACAAVATWLAEVTAPLPDREAARFRGLTKALLVGDASVASAAAVGLVGLGAGSTPTGDDLLAGLFAGAALLLPVLPADTAVSPAPQELLRVLGDEVVAISDTATTAVSGALLRHALRGELCRPAARLLVALSRDVPTAHRRAALDALLTVGSLSGRDLAVGLLAAGQLAAALATAPSTSVPGRT